MPSSISSPLCSEGISVNWCKLDLRGHHRLYPNKHIFWLGDHYGYLLTQSPAVQLLNRILRILILRLHGLLSGYFLHWLTAASRSSSFWVVQLANTCWLSFLHLQHYLKMSFTPATPMYRSTQRPGNPTSTKYYFNKCDSLLCFTASSPLCRFEHFSHNQQMHVQSPGTAHNKRPGNHSFNSRTLRISDLHSWYLICKHH